MTIISSIFLFVLAVFPMLINEPVNPHSKEIQKEIRKHLGLDPPVLKALIKNADLNTDQNFGNFYSVSSSEAIRGVGFLYVGRVYTCRQESCSNNVAVSEYFDYFILYNSSKQVEFVKITAYKATRGHQMASAGWLRQYKKYDGSKPLKVGKDIDAISGATVSVNAINEDIRRVTKQLLNDLNAV
jgi:hypothetical protein